MPIYFFDVTEDCLIPDMTGTDLQDPEAARTHAIALICDILANQDPVCWHGDVVVVEARDDIGLVLFTLTVGARAEPVVRRAKAQWLEARTHAGGRLAQP